MKDKSFLTQNGINVEAGLNLFGDIDTYNETLSEFSETITEKLDELLGYKEVSDMPNYSILVHSLKSDAKYLGFETLAVMTEEHEIESKKNNLLYVCDNFDNLMDEFEKILNIVSSYLGREKLVVKKSVSSNLPTDKIILVIDDSDIITNFVKKVLGGGSNVICVANGAQGVEVIQQYRSLLAGILLDLNMPNLNGFGLLDILKEDPELRDIPVSIITGETDPISLEKLKQYNILDTLVKPFNERDIKLLVDRVMELYELRINE